MCISDETSVRCVCGYICLRFGACFMTGVSAGGECLFVCVVGPGFDSL